MNAKQRLARRSDIMRFYLKNPNSSLKELSEVFKVTINTVKAAIEGNIHGDKLSYTTKKNKVVALVNSSLNGLSPYRKRAFLMDLQEEIKKIETFI